jgi:hypothetical protein
MGDPLARTQMIVHSVSDSSLKIYRRFHRQRLHLFSAKTCIPNSKLQLDAPLARTRISCPQLPQFRTPTGIDLVQLENHPLAVKGWSPAG